uniref:Ankyrin-1 n=1 Tax=Magallana gigas TaxID=29159 RepID=K1PQ97_MAGGI
MCLAKEKKWDITVSKGSENQPWVSNDGCKRGKDMECTLNEAEERTSLIAGNVKSDFSTEQSNIEKAIFNQWKQDDFFFISTKACKVVEKNIKSRNLVIVTGHSGSGKSTIIHHIALKYRAQGWAVKRVKKVEDIVDEYSSSRFQKFNTICVLNDPFGKESFDELLNNSWQTYEEELKLYLKTAKLIMSCRNHIISDTRLTRFFVYQSYIVDIDENKNKLTVDEKRQILTKYTIGMNLSDKDCDKVVEVETYFPLLCKLYYSKEYYGKKDISFFTEPVTVLIEEILAFRAKDKTKYCALALLVLFNNDICVSDLLKDRDTEKKFNHTLKLCGLPENTPPSAIRDSLNSLKGCFVKTIGDKYQFNHDFVMEVTTQVFGTDYPAEIIRYADTGFLRRRVRLEDCEKHNGSFNIYLSERYIEELGERLFTELFKEHFLDVVLSPCLRNENIIELLKKKIAANPENIHMFLKRKKVTIDKQEVDDTSKNLLLTKLSFLDLEKEVSPLIALIVFCHTQISQYCFNILQQVHSSSKSNFFALILTKLFHKQKTIDDMTCYFSAMCCNGSTELINNVFKDPTKKLFAKSWKVLFPIHIVVVFHNYRLLFDMIKNGVDVNLKTIGKGGWTPLILAAGNDTQEHGNYNHEESDAERRDRTVQLLLSSEADINLCKENGTSPLFIACQNGHDSTVQLLLSKGADINLCREDKASPFFIACQNGHDSTVQLLLSKGADINLCMEDGPSPLYIACQNGHDSTVQLLHNKGADINLCMECGSSPLFIACQNGHDSTVQLLLSKGADINLCMEGGSSPLFIACQNGHDSTVQLLLSKGADTNLCMADGASPLYIACQNGYDSTVQLLLSNRADINICMENKASPLYEACQNGHDSIVQLLLREEADINLCMEDGTSPLFMACQNGHDSTVQLLLSKGADINLCMEYGASPLYMACQNGHNSTVQLLLNKGADINLCMEDGASPLFIACQKGHDSTVQLLLDHGADINSYNKDNVSPLYIAFAWRQYKTVNILLKRNADTRLSSGLNPSYLDLVDKNDSTIQYLLRKDNIYNNIYDPDSYFSLFVFCHVERMSRALFFIHFYNSKFSKCLL